MLRRVYWVSDRLPNVVTAGVGYRASDDAPYERSIERWVRVDGVWSYCGDQPSGRVTQLESHPLIRAKLETAAEV